MSSEAESETPVMSSSSSSTKKLLGIKKKLLPNSKSMASNRERDNINMNIGDTQSSSNSNSSGAASSSKRFRFLEIVRQSNVSCQNGDYPKSISLYSEALKLDPNNHILYSNRSAALIKMGQFGKALQDALKAREINPKWAKAYYRQGVALQCLGKFDQALAAFSAGLAEDQNSDQLLNGLIEAGMKSPLKEKLEPTFLQLQSMKLEKSGFVVTSVLGQELLSQGFFHSAVVVLESALKIGTGNLKLTGSVYSALSSAYWALNLIEKAIGYMQLDLSATKSLGDVAGECRAHGNLGVAFFSKGNYKEALTSHRYQLVLAMKCSDTVAATGALTSLGHVYTAIGDFTNALASHKQCVQLVKQMESPLQEAREIGNVGAVYLAIGEFDKAIECHMEHLRIAETILKNKVEEARAYSNLGSSYHYRRNFQQAIMYHNYVLSIAKELSDRNIEARAYAGLGHAARCRGDYDQARICHEKQLDMALITKDRVSEGRACSNLGIIYQLTGDHESALKLHQAHLNIASNLGDRAGMGRAYGNIGNAYSAMEFYEEAIKYHKEELAISKEVNDRGSEASTHGNLGVAFQAIGSYEKALGHYHSHLSISRELKDGAGEACALLNLGNCHSSRSDFTSAIPFYENYLALSQELQDTEGEAKACHFLGYAHFSLGNFREALRYYNQDLSLAKEKNNQENIAKAYCNLGLCYMSLGNLDNALQCARYFLSVSQSLGSVISKFRALGNLGNVLLKMNKIDEAIKMFQKQVILGKSHSNKVLEGAAYGSLGLAQRMLKNYDKAIHFHNQELEKLKEIKDSRGQCRANGNLGAVYMSLGNYKNAIKCYEAMLVGAKELADSLTEAQAYTNLGIANLNQGNFEEATNYFESQLNVLNSLPQNSYIIQEKGRALTDLGTCLSSLSLDEQAIRSFEKALIIYLKLGDLKEQERINRLMGQAYKTIGNTAQSLASFEKRLSIINLLAEQSNSSDSEILKLKISCYCEIGSEYLEVQKFEQAMGCFKQSLSFSREKCDKNLESFSLSLMGKCSQLMGNAPEAIEYFENELEISKEIGEMYTARAHKNLGLIHESLGNLDRALIYQEKFLSIISQSEDYISKVSAYSSIGRLQHTLGNNIQAIAYLANALQLVETCPNNIGTAKDEEEAKIRHFLGLSLWRQGDCQAAQNHLEKSANLLEQLRTQNLQDTRRNNTEYSLVLYDKQIVTYHALQRILYSMGKTDTTLLMAEKCRTIADIKKVQNNNNTIISSSQSQLMPFSTNNMIISPLFQNVDSILQRVNKLRKPILYFSIVGGHLFSWLIVPERGIVKFNESCINNEDEDEEIDKSHSTNQNSETKSPPNMGSLLEKYIIGTREAIDIELNGIDSLSNPNSLDNGTNDLWQQHLEELGDKLNQENDKTGYLRMVSRNHRFNCSSYSLSSLFSLGSATGSVKSLNNCGNASRAGSTRSSRYGGGTFPSWQGPSSLRSLYQMLLAPFEDELTILEKTCYRELYLVIEADLLLVPFPILRMGPTEPYLCERFKLIYAPAISSIKDENSISSCTDDNCDGHHQKSTSPSILVVGNPFLPKYLKDQWGWQDLPRAENESNLIAELFHVTPLTTTKATKEKILNQFSSADCIHLATHISWKLSAIVCSPLLSANSSNNSSEKNSNNSSDGDGDDTASFSDYLLTAGEILKLKLSAKLVVLSCCHDLESSTEGSSMLNVEGIIGLSKSLLAAGAVNVLISLWPVPESSSRILFRTFYTSLLRGASVSNALTESMHTVRKTKNMSQPAYWAGYLLVGSDGILVPGQEERITHALFELLKTQERSRDTLRVTLHLIEKTLQRIRHGQKNAMYTTLKSIENKVGHINGWKEILASVGFRFEPASNGLPAACFFPRSDPGQHLVKTSAKLQALLGLSPSSIHAFSKLLFSSTPERDLEIISILRNSITQTEINEMEADSVKVRVNVKIWGITGCHEILAALGFDLIEVGDNEVILEVGKHLTPRMLQLALQAALAIFDSEEILQESHQNNISERISLENIEFTASKEIMGPPLSYLPIRSHVSLGKVKGAFTSYTRNAGRGEPDGQNITPTEKVNDITNVGNGIQTNYTSILSKLPPIVSLRQTNYENSNKQQQQINYGHQQHVGQIQRADSSSSESSINVWENGKTHQDFSQSARNKKITLKSWNKLRTSNQFSQQMSLQKEEPSSSSNDSIPVTTPYDDNHPVEMTEENPANNVSGNSINTRNINSPRQISSNYPHLTRELPINDIYNERNIGLDLAPTLSKILLSNRISLSQVVEGCHFRGKNGDGGGGGKSDSECCADDSLSAFDQLSIADSAPESKNNYSSSTSTVSTRSTCSKSTTNIHNMKQMPPIPMKRTSMSAASLLLNPSRSVGKGKQPSKLPVNTNRQPLILPGLENNEINGVRQAGEHFEIGSSSSSKSSPSDLTDLSKRDEGDGRSLTDSQYGSYSPSSMAQNDLVTSSVTTTPSKTVTVNNIEKESSEKNSNTIQKMGNGVRSVINSINKNHINKSNGKINVSYQEKIKMNGINDNPQISPNNDKNLQKSSEC